MKKLILSSIIICIFIFSFILIKRFKQSKNTAAYTIGILQTASHPALDAARDGFIGELKNKMGNGVEFVVQNAQGSVSAAHTIAQQFHANTHYDAFFAIATPAAQAMAAVEKDKPIIIAAVTDPQALGFVYPTTNVCGVTDMIDIKAEIDMLITLVPTAQTVGILYTAGETNSLAAAALMREELEARGLTAINYAIGNEADIPTIVSLACRKTDVILAPTDNTVATSINAIASIALRHKKPLIVSDNMLVQFGPLAARGVDYKECGKQAANIAYALIVEGKTPAQLPIVQPKTDTIYINKQTVAELGLAIPESLQQSVRIIQ